MQNNGLTLFHLFGFRVKIDISWLVLGILVSWTLARGYFPGQYEGLAIQTYWIMGVLGALGLFFSIVFHEFWHSWAARKMGMSVKGITLFIFGGIAEMDEQPPNPKTELLMSAAGPVSSIFFGAVCFGIYSVLGGESFRPVFIGGVIRYLAMINLILALFNLLPAFPLDGGRIFRAILWAWKKDLRAATRIAYQMGAGFGWAFIFLGIFNVFGGNWIAGLWWVMIGFFIKSASQMSYKQVLIRKSLEGEKVRDFMIADPVFVSSDMTVDEFIHHIIYKYHHKLYPVKENGKWIGCVHLKQIKNVPQDERTDKTVKMISEKCDDKNTISPDADAMSALSRMQKNNTGRLIVTENGALSGIIALRDIMKVLSLKIDFDFD